MWRIYASAVAVLVTSLTGQAAHADTWRATLSGRVTLLNEPRAGDEVVTYRWDPAQISVGNDPGIGPFAEGPLLGADWHGLVNGNSIGGSLSALGVAFYGSLVSDGAVTQLGDIWTNQSVEFWANPIPVTHTLAIFTEVYGGVPGAQWGDMFVKPNFYQTATLTIAPVPEPGTAALLGTGMLMLFGARRTPFVSHVAGRTYKA